MITTAKKLEYRHTYRGSKMVAIVKNKAVSKGHKLECWHIYHDMLFGPSDQDVANAVEFYENGTEVSQAHVANKYGFKVIEKLLGYDYIV